MLQNRRKCVYRIGLGGHTKNYEKKKKKLVNVKSVTTPTEQRTNLEVREVCSRGQLEQHSNEINLIQGSLPFFYTTNLAYLGNQAGCSPEEQLCDPPSLKWHPCKVHKYTTDYTEKVKEQQ